MSAEFIVLPKSSLRSFTAWLSFISQPRSCKNSEPFLKLEIKKSGTHGGTKSENTTSRSPVLHTLGLKGSGGVSPICVSERSSYDAQTRSTLTRTALHVCILLTCLHREALKSQLPSSCHCQVLLKSKVSTVNRRQCFQS